jgi:hypothetical protein
MADPGETWMQHQAREVDLLPVPRLELRVVATASVGSVPSTFTEACEYSLILRRSGLFGERPREYLLAVPLGRTEVMGGDQRLRNELPFLLRYAVEKDAAALGLPVWLVDATGAREWAPQVTRAGGNDRPASSATFPRGIPGATAAERLRYLIGLTLVGAPRKWVEAVAVEATNALADFDELRAENQRLKQPTLALDGVEGACEYIKRARLALHSITRADFQRLFFEHISRDENYVTTRAWPWWYSDPLAFLFNFNGTGHEKLRAALWSLAVPDAVKP